MASLRMATPYNREGIYYFRKGVPKRLQPLVGKTLVMISLGTRDPVEARSAFTLVAAEVEKEWAALQSQPHIAPSVPIRMDKKGLVALAGDLYDPMDAEIVADQEQALAWMERYNAPGQTIAQRQVLLAERFASVGGGANIRAPFHCDYGYNISLGKGVFLNFNCVILDVVAVTIGDKTQIGPGVQILTADHPRDLAKRNAGLEYGRPIHIGRNVWIGGGALILPGVTIGDDAIVGAGSVVTRDVPRGATVLGNPARLRKASRV